MPFKKSKKSGSQSRIKFPKDAIPLKKLEEETPAKKNIPKEVEDLCDSIMNSEWNAWSTRPSGELFGYLVIAKWYPKLHSWALLYVARGHVRGTMSKFFSGRGQSPIGRYVSSFSKTDRALLWAKWVKDPYFPYESVHLEDLISAMGVLYNQGERPAFNFTDKDFQPDVPENFSILDYA